MAASAAVGSDFFNGATMIVSSMMLERLRGSSRIQAEAMKSSAFLFGPREGLRRLIAGKMMGGKITGQLPRTSTLSQFVTHHSVPADELLMGDDRAAFMTEACNAPE